MAADRIERRLSAIFIADVAGYSRLMGADEEGTHTRLNEHMSALVHPAIEGHGGRIIRSAGDGILVEFASVVNSMRCAVAIQRGMITRNTDLPIEKRIEFRIGINIGDVIIDGGDIFGDGVNIAARVESECEPGGVCLSGSAFEQVRGKTRFAFDDLGEHNLKNIDRPVRLYAARMAASQAQNTKPRVSSGTPLSLPDKPSIA